MNSFLPFIIIGLASGAVYGLTAVGLVLTYKVSGLFNFAYGAIAAIGSYAFYWLNVEDHWPWGLAMAATVFVLGPFIGLLNEPFTNALTKASTVYKVVGTVGIILAVEGLATIKFGTGLIVQTQYLPTGTFEIFGAFVTWGNLIIIVIGLVIVTSLSVFFRVGYTGLAMRAVVDDHELLDLTGTNPARIRRIASVLGAMLAVFSGVLIAPNANLDAVILTFLIVQAFAAAAIGLFSNLPMAYVGGSVIGIAAGLAQKYSTSQVLSNLPSAIPFIILLLIMLLVPRRKLLSHQGSAKRSRASWRAPVPARLLTSVVVLAFLLLIPGFVGFRISSYTNGLITAILLLSLGLLVKTSGQISLCQMAFAAVGAVAFSQLEVNAGLPWILALVGAGLLTVPIGALVAIPAIRLSGLYLALATLGFGILAQYILYPLNIMFSSNPIGRLMPHPSFATGARGYYYVVLACFVITALTVVAINKGRMGRLLNGMADAPIAVNSLGLNLRVMRVSIFCISAFFAGIAGALLGVLVSRATVDQFPAFQSLVLLGVLAIVPCVEPWYALIAAAGVAIVPAYFNNPNVTNWLNVLFGVSAMAVALQNGPQAMPVKAQRLIERIFSKRSDSAVDHHHEVESAQLDAANTVSFLTTPAESVLVVQDLEVRFGGLVAVDGLNLRALSGGVTGLIGPNGAGKTTTFNVCTGLVRPTKGQILLHGENVTGLDPAARGRRGLGRTFQRMELFDSLTVRSNVALGREAAMGGNVPWRQLWATRSEHREVKRSTWEAMETCNLAGLADRQVGLLSTAERRLVELARCLAGKFDVLLLDEPSSGLDPAERAHFGRILQKVCAEKDVAVLLVEHDMSLVLGISQYVYVLDFGKLIFEGTPSEVDASPEVRTAYLGDAPLEAHAIGNPD